MKKLLLSLMVLAALTSCGKDNKVSSAPVAPINGLTNPIVINSTSGQGLASMIANPSSGFGNGVVLSGSGNNCTLKWGWLTVCSSSYSSVGTTGQTWNSIIAANPSVVFQYSSGRTVRNSDIPIATKQNELMGILNAAVAIEVQGPIYKIRVAGDVYYAIDTRYAIQMNPAATASQTSSEYFIQAF